MARIEAGDPLLTRRLTSWYNNGGLQMESPAASELVELVREVTKMLTCPLFFSSTEPPEWYCEDSELPQSDPENVITNTRQRFYERILKTEDQQWKDRKPRIPLAKEEVRARVAVRFERDEMRALGLLESRSSVSSGIFRILGLHRNLMKKVLKELTFSRPLQTTFCSIACATKFKYFKGKTLWTTKCKSCGERDSI